MPRRIAYQVEKFIPTHCPNPACLHSFDRNPWLRRRQRGYLLSLFWKGSYADQAIAVLPGAIHQAELQTDLVICTQCHNHTLRVLIERRQYIKKRDARAALQNDGFVNLQPVLQTGTHAEGGDTVECFVPRR